MYGSAKINDETWQAIKSRFKGYGFKEDGENRLVKHQVGMYFNDEINCSYVMTHEDNGLRVNAEASRVMWGLTDKKTSFNFSYWNQEGWNEPDGIALQLKNKMVNSYGMRTL